MYRSLPLAATSRLLVGTRIYKRHDQYTFFSNVLLIHKYSSTTSLNSIRDHHRDAQLHRCIFEPLFINVLFNSQRTFKTIILLLLSHSLLLLLLLLLLFTIINHHCYCYSASSSRRLYSDLRSHWCRWLYWYVPSTHFTSWWHLERRLFVLRNLADLYCVWFNKNCRIFDECRLWSRRTERSITNM